MSEGEKGVTAAEQLMSALISKMETMDSDIQVVKAENAALKNMLRSPNQLMKRMGLMSYSTPLSEDVMPDEFRGDTNNILKGDTMDVGFPTTTEDFHNTSWEKIHELANGARAGGNVEEPFKVIKKEE
mgnify:CR=1 FL=1